MDYSAHQKRTMSRVGQIAQLKAPSRKVPLSNTDYLLRFLQANYGSCLLHAQRILRISLPHSPYALALLPAIKDLGPISYVLGASTDLYNELLFIRWKHYRDLHGCADLLAEMLSQGLQVSTHTLFVWKDVERTRIRERSGVEEDKGASEKDAEVAYKDKTSWNGNSTSIRSFWWLLHNVQSGWNRWSTLHAKSMIRWNEETARKREAIGRAESYDNEAMGIGDNEVLLSEPESMIGILV